MNIKEGNNLTPPDIEDGVYEIIYELKKGRCKIVESGDKDGFFYFVTKGKFRTQVAMYKLYGRKIPTENKALALYLEDRMPLAMCVFFSPQYLGEKDKNLSKLLLADYLYVSNELRGLGYAPFLLNLGYKHSDHGIATGDTMGTLSVATMTRMAQRNPNIKLYDGTQQTYVSADFSKLMPSVDGIPINKHPNEFRFVWSKGTKSRIPSPTKKVSSRIMKDIYARLEISAEKTPEGFWYSEQEKEFPRPVEGKPWKGQEAFIRKLASVQKLAQVTAYRGFSTCRLCKKHNGSEEYSRGKFYWPEGYMHYIQEHNVKPSKAFYNFIMSSP